MRWIELNNFEKQKYKFWKEINGHVRREVRKK